MAVQKVLVIPPIGIGLTIDFVRENDGRLPAPLRTGPNNKLRLLFRNTKFKSSGAAAAGRQRRPVVAAGPGQSKAGKAGEAGEMGSGQNKPRLGTAGEPAKPKQAKN